LAEAWRQQLVPGEWNKLAREKKLADELAKKADMKGKGPEDGKAVVGSPTVATCRLGARRIMSAAVVPDTDKEAEGAKKAVESPEVAPGSWRAESKDYTDTRTKHGRTPYGLRKAWSDRSPLIT
jgi:hypothetical protein